MHHATLLIHDACCWPCDGGRMSAPLLFRNMHLIVSASFEQVKALQQVVAAGPGQASSQHAGGRQSRRRTTSYKPYRHTRRPNRKLQQAAAAGAADAVPQGGDGSAAGPTASEAPVASERPTSRAMRRRPGRLRGAAERSCATEPAVARQAGQLPRQLETHTWHAKRMSMQERWAKFLTLSGVCCLPMCARHISMSGLVALSWHRNAE